MNVSRTWMMRTTRRSKRCLELQLRVAEGCRSGSLSVTSRSWRKTRELTTVEKEENKARFGMYRLLILSGEVFNSGKNLFSSGPILSGAGAFEVYFWAEGSLSVELQLSGREEGLVGGSEPVVEVDEDESMTTGNAVVR